MTIVEGLVYGRGRRVQNSGETFEMPGFGTDRGSHLTGQSQTDQESGS